MLARSWRFHICHTAQEGTGYSLAHRAAAVVRTTNCKLGLKGKVAVS